MIYRRLPIGALLERVGTPWGLLTLGYVALAILAWRTLGDHPMATASIPETLARAVSVLEPADVAGPGLLFIFNPADCPDCLRLGRHWNAVHDQGKVRVLGLALTRNGESNAGEIGTDFGYRFPVVAGDGPELSRALLALGQDTTPVTVVVDHRNRPILIVPPLRDPVEQWLHTEIVRTQIDRLRHPTDAAVVPLRTEGLPYGSFRSGAPKVRSALGIHNQQRGSP